MADVPAAVTDTHALIFHAAGTGMLGRRAKAHFDASERQQALVYVPMAVVWEVSLLARAVHINLRRPVRVFFGDLFTNPAYHPHELTPHQVFWRDDIALHARPVRRTH